MKKKIYSLNELSKKLKSNRFYKKKIILCHGVFDLLHIGHIKHFEEAKKLGDILVVTITPDKYVNKGPSRPVFNSNLRAEALASLESVDYLAVNKWQNAIETIKLIKPEIYCKGPDYKNKEDDLTKKIYEEEKAVKSYGGKIHITSAQKFSSGNLINNHLSNLTYEQKKFIAEIRKEFTFNQIVKHVNDLYNKKTLIIGEAIIDEYVFCETLGKSGKEPILSLKKLNSEIYYGGAIAVANHISGFCKKVTLFTMIGQNDKFKNDILKNNAKNIKVDFFKKTNAPTILKRKYVDNINKNKILGIYEINDELVNSNDQSKIEKQINKYRNKFDHVVVLDYGHGFISEKIANNITKISKSMSLNAQLNAANLGLHTINNYKNIETVVINEMEMRLEMRDRYSSINNLLKKLSSKLNIKNLIVTRGKNGSTLYNKYTDQYIDCPAFAVKVVDKIGAGDAMISMVSLVLSSKINKKLSLFIGSLAAAQSVESIGNSKEVNKTLMLRTIENLLK
ncbi:PfkB family carbohydrate kinase [Pelagibacteraceae bacterium]|nr:PfkB family carbohydrate kinase [Pelagibacteraceae bacterium]